MNVTSRAQGALAPPHPCAVADPRTCAAFSAARVAQQESSRNRRQLKLRSAPTDALEIHHSAERSKRKGSLGVIELILEAGAIARHE